MMDLYDLESDQGSDVASISDLQLLLKSQDLSDSYFSTKSGDMYAIRGNDFEDRFLIVKSPVKLTFDLGPNLTGLIKQVAEKRFLGNAADNLRNVMLEVLRVIFPQKR